MKSVIVLVLAAAALLPRGYAQSFTQDGEGQTQAKTDEQAVCLLFIEKMAYPKDWSDDFSRRLPVPKVDCYDHVTYVHVNVTDQELYVGKVVRGIILYDNRSSSCSPDGCPVHLLVQGANGFHGDALRNYWTQGFEVKGGNMQLLSTTHEGWYDVVAAYGAKETIYQHVGYQEYEDVSVVAREKKRTEHEARGRRAVALSSGLHSGQTQAAAAERLIAQGYKQWNCASADGHNLGCVSQKGNVTIRLLFDHHSLVFAQFVFDGDHFPGGGKVSLVSSALQKCSTRDADADGDCLNF